MQTSIKLNVPDEAIATVTISGTIRQIKELISQTEHAPEANHYPLYQVNQALREVIDRANRAWSQEVADKPE